MIKTGPATLVLGLGTMVSHGFGLSLVPAMLPRIEHDFDSGYGVLGLAIATGLLAYLVGALLASWTLERLPTRTVLFGTLLLTGLGLLAAAAAQSPAVIAASVVVLGVSAPISWTTTTHVARVTVEAGSLALVTAGATGGAAVGTMVNGVLVQTSASLHTWRISFVFAALVAALVVIASLALFRRPIDQPASSADRGAARGYRAVLTSRSGRIVVVTSGVSGVAAFTFAAFLTATAIDEMGVSSLSAAALFWVIGLVGAVSGLVVGRVGDRRTPLFGMVVITACYGVSLVILALFWRYPALLVAAVGLGILNYAVWGLVATEANRSFEPEIAVRAVSLGLVAAAGLGATGNALSGAWIDATESMRAPIAVAAVLTCGLALWLASLYRSGGGSPPEPAVAFEGTDDEAAPYDAADTPKGPA